MNILRHPMMYFITVIRGLLMILCTVQVVICRVGPDPNKGVACGRTPSYGEYCDRFGSGLIKSCSPCNIDQLRNNDISFPEECAILPCPWRCPQEISDQQSPAPKDSCDLTTTSLTTLDTTTDSPSTAYVHGAQTSSSTSIQALSNITSSFLSTSPSNTSDHSPWPVKYIYIPVIGGVVFIAIMAILACCIKKRKCNKGRLVVTSSSTEPMIAANEIEMTPPQTPTAPVINPGQTSVEITTHESNIFAKLGCDCAEDPIPVGPEGVTCTLNGLLPSSRYDIVLGTWHDTDFHPKHHEVIETTGETPDVSRCTFSLHNLKEHIENNPKVFQDLKAKFGHVKNEDLAILRALSRVLGVASLTDVVGPPLFEEIISVDNELRSEEDSIKVFSIQLALRDNMDQSTQVPDFMAGISKTLSSIHRECLPCRHLVCQIKRNSSETTV